MKEIKYLNLYGRHRHYLAVITPLHSLYIGWEENGGKYKVYSVEKYSFRERDFMDKGDYHPLNSDIAADIIMAAMHDLQISMPYRAMERTEIVGL